jgi:ubiquinone biosynthesis O-methyltransferase
MVDTFIYDNKSYTRTEIEEVLRKARKNAEYDSRFQAVLKMADGKKVLDVGCHVGLLSRILAERGREVVGVDILESALKIAQTFNQVNGVRYQRGDLFDLKYNDGEFDCILFLETIEHVHDPSRFLKEFKRILKPGGSLIISTPNAVSYLNILYQLPIFSGKKQRQFAELLKTEPKNTGPYQAHLLQ